MKRVFLFAAIVILNLIPQVGVCDTSMYFDQVGKAPIKNALIVRFFDDAAYALVGQMAMTRVDFKTKAAVFLVPSKMIGAPLAPAPIKLETALTTDKRTVDIEVDGVKKTLSCSLLRVIEFPKTSECMADLGPYLTGVTLANFLTARDVIDALKLGGIYRQSQWASVITSVNGLEIRLTRISHAAGLEKNAVFDVSKYKMSTKSCTEAECKKMLPVTGPKAATEPANVKK